MEAVYGVAKAGEVRKAFVAHLRSRMRRVVRRHDKPYAIFEAFGGKPDGSFEESEHVPAGQSSPRWPRDSADSGCHFDFYCVDFWVDYYGDLKRFDPVRFPHGLDEHPRGVGKLGHGAGPVDR